MTDGNVTLDPSQTGCLPLTGGTITGDIYLSKGVYTTEKRGTLCLNGGTDWRQGAYIEISGINSSYPGYVQICAKNSSGKESELTLQPNGTITWCGNAVAMSKDYLPLSGGTMNGRITFTLGTALSRNCTDDYLSVYGGTGNDGGARLDLCGATKPTDAGRFSLNANNGSSKSSFVGTPEGSLFWNGKEIERVNSGNLYWIRYENGIQICTGGTDVTDKSYCGVNFPVPFVRTPSIVCQETGLNQDKAISAMIGDENSTGFTVQQYRGNSPDSFCLVWWIAIGRWK